MSVTKNHQSPDTLHRLCGAAFPGRAVSAVSELTEGRRHTRSEAFLEGYGQERFSAAEMRRIAWYDLFLYITMVTECFFRQYEDASGIPGWLNPLPEASWEDVRRS